MWLLVDRKSCETQQLRKRWIGNAAAARQCRNQTFNRRTTMAVKLTQINLTNLPTSRAIEALPRAFRDNRSTNGGIEPKIAVRRVPRVPDTDDAFGLAGRLGRNDVAGSLLDPVARALVGAHAQIMRGDGHWSSC
jgi:hypothetical protein